MCHGFELIQGHRLLLTAGLVIRGRRNDNRQNREITLGFTGDTECDWHTHMSLFRANTPSEEFEIAVDFTDKVINDNNLIVHSSIQGYYPTDDSIDEIGKKREQGETLDILKWSDL